MIWFVKLTLCYPKKWKVYPKSKYQETNDPENFFEFAEDAWNEAFGREQREIKCSQKMI